MSPLARLRELLARRRSRRPVPGGAGGADGDGTAVLPGPPATTEPRGVVLAGAAWDGTPGCTARPGRVVVDATGVVAAVLDDERPPPADLPVVTGAWVGPGLVDAHVHLAFGEPGAVLAGGVVACRDLGAPPPRAAAWRRDAPLRVAVAGPVVTAPGGYPSRSWGADGFAVGLGDAALAPALVARLVADGVDLVKVAVEPAGGAPVPSTAVLAALVRAAHEAGLGVTAHALTADAVRAVLDAGVDELAHTPTEPLPAALVDRVAAAGVPVVSSVQCLAGSGSGGRGAVSNAAALHAAGALLRYGTDLGNSGTRPGADPRELDRLAAAGLGREGALRRAVDGRGLLGLDGPPGLVLPGEPAGLVVLADDPLRDPSAWRVPRAVVVGHRGRLRVVRPAG